MSIMKSIVANLRNQDWIRICDKKKKYCTITDIASWNIVTLLLSLFHYRRIPQRGKNNTDYEQNCHPTEHSTHSFQIISYSLNLISRRYHSCSFVAGVSINTISSPIMLLYISNILIECLDIHFFNSLQNDDKLQRKGN